MSDLEVQNTIDQLSTLIENLTTQCNQIDKNENKEQLIDFKQQIRKLENRLSLILPETKLPIGSLNGAGDKSDRLKARAARFGSENDQTGKKTDVEKLNKRKERFNSTAETGDDAKKRRLARFGSK